MSVEDLCLLCLKSCIDNKSLCDERIYEIVLLYFDPEVMAFTDESSEKFMCRRCLSQILDFHNFRQYVLQAHSSHLSNITLEKTHTEKNAENIITEETGCNNVLDQEGPSTSKNATDNRYTTSEAYYDVIVKEEYDMEYITPCGNYERINIYQTNEDELKQLAKMEEEDCIEQIFEKTHKSLDSNGSEVGLISSNESLDENSDDSFLLKTRYIKRKRKDELDCIICQVSFSSRILLQHHFRTNHTSQQHYQTKQSPTNNKDTNEKPDANQLNKNIKYEEQKRQLHDEQTFLIQRQVRISEEMASLVKIVADATYEMAESAERSAKAIELQNEILKEIFHVFKKKKEHK
uniref:C2H2-type domain-containing protein n=1 Tax=Stomoxys calcitrans TaxID=35570 RepID=A0A1I8Q0X5_STOCA